MTTDETLVVHQQGLAEACEQLEAELQEAGHTPNDLMSYKDLVEQYVILRVEALHRAFIRRQLKELEKHPESYVHVEFTNQEAGRGQELFVRRDRQSLVPKIMKGKGNYSELLEAVVTRLSGTEAVHGLTLKTSSGTICGTPMHTQHCKDCTTIIVAI